MKLRKRTFLASPFKIDVSLNVHALILGIVLKWQPPSVTELHCVCLTVLRAEYRSCYTVHRVRREAVARAVEHTAEDTTPSLKCCSAFMCFRWNITLTLKKWSPPGWVTCVSCDCGFVYQPAKIKISILWRMTKNCLMLQLNQHQLSALVLSSKFCNLPHPSLRDFLLTETNISLS